MDRSEVVPLRPDESDAQAIVGGPACKMSSRLSPRGSSTPIKTDNPHRKPVRASAMPSVSVALAKKELSSNFVQVELRVSAGLRTGPAIMEALRRP